MPWAEHLTEVFDSQVRGPVVEQQARIFIERFAYDDTVPGERAHVGPSRRPSARRITAIGEAKASDLIGR